MLLLTVSISALALFYGMPVNGWLLCVAVLGVLVGGLSLGPHRLWLACWERPRTSAAALFALLAIALAQCFSQSRASGLPAAWSLALVPLLVLIVGALGSAGWRLFAGLAAAVSIMASISLWQLFTAGTRPTAPLLDANNFATLLYLIWLTGSGWHLQRVWYGPARTSEQSLFLIWTLLLTAPAFATLSRAGALILVAGAVAWLAYALRWRLPKGPALRLLTVLLVAFLVVQPQATESGGDGFSGEDLRQGLDLRAALNGAALDFYLERPWTGIGINVFPLRYRAERPEADQITAGLSPHNDYLQMLTEGGPLLLLALLLLAGTVGWRALRAFLPCTAPGRPVAVAEFGVLLALGAALAHATINFVLMTSMLAALVGVLAGLAGFEAPRLPCPPGRLYRPALAAAALVALSSFAALALDGAAAAVFHGQREVPLAVTVREDPDRLRTFARLMQRLQPQRGEPLLAEASVVQRELARYPDSWFYRQQLLALYRSALEKDPWNPRGFLLFYDFLRVHPELVEQVDERHLPGALLQQALALDPLFLPAYQRIVERLRELGRPETAYAVVRDRLGPWLQWLYLNDQRAAESYLDYLRGWAQRLGEADTLAALDRREQAMRLVQPQGKHRWFWDDAMAP